MRWCGLHRRPRAGQAFGRAEPTRYSAILRLRGGRELCFEPLDLGAFNSAYHMALSTGQPIDVEDPRTGRLTARFHPSEVILMEATPLGLPALSP